jgi:hypothetical protein
MNSNHYILGYKINEINYGKTDKFSVSGSEGDIAECGISLQYHPLLWWAGRG